MTGSLRAIIAKLIIFAIFTLAVTAMLAAVIGNVDPFGNYYEVKADFTDATGLLTSDVVRIAGVDVGKVTGAEVTDEGLARVHMQITTDVLLPTNVQAIIRFRNLLGQRMIELSQDPEDPDPGRNLPQDGSARIPASQTTPSFDLGIVFNNLRPTLQALDPEDANIVMRAVVQIFAGREERVHQLVTDLADLSQSLGDRGPVITDLITNLDRVLADLAERDTELRSILDSFDAVMQTLAGRSVEIGRTVENVGSVSNDVADILAQNRPALDVAIGQLADVLRVAARHKADLDATLKALPDTTHTLNRATTYGEFGNLFGVCLTPPGVCAQDFAAPTGLGLGAIFDAAAGVAASPDGIGEASR